VYSPQQVAGWRLVTDAVHARGGRIVCQLWHVGRISHVDVQPGGVAPVSSTARAAESNTWIRGELVPCSTPRALRADEIPGIVAAPSRQRAGCPFAPRCASDLPICAQQQPPAFELEAQRSSSCWLHHSGGGHG
jgi:hypothetical protein